MTIKDPIEAILILEKITESMQKVYPDCEYSIFIDEQLRLMQISVEYKDNTKKTKVHYMDVESIVIILLELLCITKELIEFVNEKSKK